MGTGDDDESDRNGFGLTTARLLLRRPRLCDAAAIVGLADDWEVAKNLARLPHPYRLVDAEAFIPRARRLAPPTLVVAATQKPGGNVVGMGGIERSCDGDLVLGYWLGRRFWGLGYATEIAQALVDHAFDAAATDRLTVNCRVTNAASRRVLQKCGFQPDGGGMMDSLALGGTVPVERYALDRATWRGLKAWR